MFHVLKKVIYVICVLTASQAESSNVGLSGEAASGSCERVDFYNYFGVLDQGETQKLVEDSFRSILKRLKVVHVDPRTGQISSDNFFDKITTIATQKVPGAKVYIAGGMVRSLLGYIYKKLYHAGERAKAANQWNNKEQRAMVVRDTFLMIIDGRKRDDALLSNMGEVQYKKDAKSPYAVTDTTRTKDILTLAALGIGSDYDILIEFPKDAQLEDITLTKKSVADFINSAETHFKLREDKSVLKKAMVPIADVKEYDSQIKRASSQGGSTLDWLAFPINTSEGIRMPDNHRKILQSLFEGHLQYLPNGSGVDDPDKQTMRGLRSLLELPCLTLDEQSRTTLVREIDTLTSKTEMSDGAKEQVDKMMRNARFEGAHNRFKTSIPCMPDAELTQKIQQMSDKHHLKIRSFLRNQKIATRVLSQKAQSINTCLIPVEKFIENHTDKGYLHHGTPDMANVLSMIRNGLVQSDGTRGTTAAFGRGTYSSKERSIANEYAKSTGVVLDLKVNDHPNLRILDAIKCPEYAENPDQYEIDIVIPAEHVLLLNSDAVIFPKSIVDLARMHISTTILELEKKLEVNNRVIYAYHALIQSPYWDILSHTQQVVDNEIQQYTKPVVTVALNGIERSQIGAFDLLKTLLQKGLGYHETLTTACKWIKFDNRLKGIGLKFFHILLEKEYGINKAIETAVAMLGTFESLDLFEKLFAKGQGFNEAIGAAIKGYKSRDKKVRDAAFRIWGKLFEMGKGFDAANEEAVKASHDEDHEVREAASWLRTMLDGFTPKS